MQGLSENPAQVESPLDSPRPMGAIELVTELITDIATEEDARLTELAAQGSLLADKIVLRLVELEELLAPGTQSLLQRTRMLLDPNSLSAPTNTQDQEALDLLRSIRNRLAHKLGEPTEKQTLYELGKAKEGYLSEDFDRIKDRANHHECVLRGLKGVFLAVRNRAVVHRVQPDKSISKNYRTAQENHAALTALNSLAYNIERLAQQQSPSEMDLPVTDQEIAAAFNIEPGSSTFEDAKASFLSRLTTELGACRTNAERKKAFAAAAMILWGDIVELKALGDAHMESIDKSYREIQAERDIAVVSADAREAARQAGEGQFGTEAHHLDRVDLSGFEDTDWTTPEEPNGWEEILAGDPEDPLPLEGGDDDESEEGYNFTDSVVAHMPEEPIGRRSRQNKTVPVFGKEETTSTHEPRVARRIAFTKRTGGRGRTGDQIAQLTGKRSPEKDEFELERMRIRVQAISRSLQQLRETAVSMQENKKLQTHVFNELIETWKRRANGLAKEARDLNRAIGGKAAGKEGEAQREAALSSDALCAIETELNRINAVKERRIATEEPVIKTKDRGTESRIKEMEARKAESPEAESRLSKSTPSPSKTPWWKRPRNWAMSALAGAAFATAAITGVFQPIQNAWNNLFNSGDNQITDVQRMDAPTDRTAVTASTLASNPTADLDTTNDTAENTEVDTTGINTETLWGQSFIEANGDTQRATTLSNNMVRANALEIIETAGNLDLNGMWTTGSQAKLIQWQYELAGFGDVDGSDSWDDYMQTVNQADRAFVTAQVVLIAQPQIGLAL